MARIKNWKKTKARTGRYEWTNIITKNEIRVSQIDTTNKVYLQNSRKPWLAEFLTKEGLLIQVVSYGYVPRDVAMKNALDFMKKNPLGIGSI